MLEPTGFVRRVDELGRLVLPKELRDRFGIADGDSVGIWLDGDQVVLVRHMDTCALCGGHEGLTAFKGKPVCRGCRLEAAASRRSLPDGSAG